MADYKKLVPFVLKWEGGFVNDPLDKGGATNKGVTIATYTEYRKRKGQPFTTVGDLKNMSESEWGEIFKQMYWDKWKADEIKNQSLSDILVDWVWASGAWGIKIPQRILGVSQDGIVGPKTIAALNAAHSENLFAQIKQARINFVDDIVRNNPSQNRFINGWKNRINQLKFQL